MATDVSHTEQGLARVLSDEASGVARSGASARDYALAIGACAAATGVGTPLLQYFDPTNIAMLYLLTVLLVSVNLGYGPGVLCAFLSVALFDFFFVPPRFSFTVDDIRFTFTFAVMLAVAWTTAHLSASLRIQAALASARERSTRALYEMARQLAAATNVADVDRTTIAFLRDALELEAAILIRNPDGPLASVSGPTPGWVDMSLALNACMDATCADLESQSPTAYFPLVSPQRIHGVLAVRSHDETGGVLRENAELIDIVASLVSMVMDRLR